MAKDIYEAREEIVNQLGEILFRLSDPEDLKGEEVEAREDYMAFATIMVGSLDLKVESVSEDGTITATIRVLDLDEYVEKSLSE